MAAESHYADGPDPTISSIIVHGFLILEIIKETGTATSVALDAHRLMRDVRIQRGAATWR
jgi:hypothetical protein